MKLQHFIDNSNEEIGEIPGQKFGHPSLNTST